jgi:hypothetical protein
MNTSSFRSTMNRALTRPKSSCLRSRSSSRRISETSIAPSRTLDEVTREIAALRDKIEGRRDAYEKEYQRTSQIIESRFDEEVRKVFKRLGDDLPEGLVQLDRDLADLVEGYLASRAIAYKRFDKAGRVVFEITPGSQLAAEIGEGLRFATGDARGLTDAEPLNLAHPLVRAAIADARAWPGGSVELLLPATLLRNSLRWPERLASSR